MDAQHLKKGDSFYWAEQLRTAEARNIRLPAFRGNYCLGVPAAVLTRGYHLSIPTACARCCKRKKVACCLQKQRKMHWKLHFVFKCQRIIQEKKKKRNSCGFGTAQLIFVLKKIQFLTALLIHYARWQEIPIALVSKKCTKHFLILAEEFLDFYVQETPEMLCQDSDLWVSSLHCSLSPAPGC